MSAKLDGIHADHLDLSGMRVCGDLSMRHAKLRGRMVMMPLGKKGKVAWRFWVQGAAILDRMQVTTIQIDGAKIVGFLHLIDGQIQSLYARPCALTAKSFGWYRPTVGGKIVASGAVIENALEATGIQVSGLFEYVTGRCGRIRLSVACWSRLEKDEQVPELVCSQIDGLVLSDVSTDASIILSGIKVAGGSNDDLPFGSGSIILDNVRVGASFRFWPRGGEKTVLAGFDIRNDSDRETLTNEVRALRAEIAGAVDLRGVRVGGTLDLGRLVVAGELKIDNADIGRNLRACDVDREDTCCSKVTDLSADRLKVDGDADFRGLELKADLRARNTEIKGRLLLATDDGDPGGPAMALVPNGVVDLTASRAAAVVIDSGSFGETAQGSEKARVKLAHCRLGRLRVRDSGADDKAWRTSIDLTGIEVGDWDIIAETQAPLLLEAAAKPTLLESPAQPFDGRVPLDMEQRLARTGKKWLANKIFLDAQWHRAKQRALERNWLRWTTGTSAGLLVAASLVLAIYCGGCALALLLIGAIAIAIVSEPRANYWAKYAFNKHGTQPWFMLGWLLLTILPVWLTFANPANVEPPAIAAGAEQGTRSPDASRSANPANVELPAAAVQGARSPDASRSADPASDWNAIRALGMALTYAVPIFPGNRTEVARPRLEGPICVDHLYRPLQFGWLVTSARGQVDPSTGQCGAALRWCLSPHSLALGISVIQIVLWLFIAASLPAIVRRPGGS